MKRNSIYESILNAVFKIWRKKRFKIFLKILKPTPQQTLLDVGGSCRTWTPYEKIVQRIDLLNIHKIVLQDKIKEKYNLHTIVGNGCDLKLPDKSYDIVFSNSVIEHVGSFDKQKKFSHEMMRVGKKIWIQTPSFFFPIEPHYLFPCVHWFPKKIQKLIIPFTPHSILRKRTKKQIDNTLNEIRLLKKSELRTLFPNCKILTERFLFFPKSYVVYRS